MDLDTFDVYNASSGGERYEEIYGGLRLVLIVGGFLLFRFTIFNIYPELTEQMRAGTLNLKQMWEGLTVTQKLYLTATEIPMYAWFVPVLVGLVRLATGRPRKGRK